MYMYVIPHMNEADIHVESNFKLSFISCEIKNQKSSGFIYMYFID